LYINPSCCLTFLSVGLIISRNCFEGGLVEIRTNELGGTWDTIVFTICSFRQDGERLVVGGVTDI
jgi:hypothetical protein